MKLALLAFAAGLLMSGQSRSAPCTTMRFEAVNSLSIQQIGQLASEQAKSNGQHTLVLRSFDAEDRPWRGMWSGSWQAGAFLMVAAGDIGETPVGALIWTSEAVELTAENLPTEGFRIIARKHDENCSPVIAEVHVLADGTVLANQQRLGKLQ